MVPHPPAVAPGAPPRGSPGACGSRRVYTPRIRGLCDTRPGTPAACIVKDLWFYFGKGRNSVNVPTLSLAA